MLEVWSKQRKIEKYGKSFDVVLDKIVELRLYYSMINLSYYRVILKLKFVIAFGLRLGSYLGPLEG